MKTNIYHYIVLLVAVVSTLLTSCSMMDYHPYDVKVDGDKYINSINISRIEAACGSKDTLRFVVAGDTQGWYDDTRDLVSDVNKRADSLDFFIHTGDFTDYATTDEFVWQRNVLNKLSIPYVGVIGNHDCLGTGPDAYKAVFGPLNDSFIAGRVKFLLLNTNPLEFNYADGVPDLDFIAAQATDRNTEFDRTVAVMHAHPFSDVFADTTLSTKFEQALLQMPGIMFCLNGHDHSITQTTWFDDGLMYYQSANAAKRVYYIFTITPSGYSYEIVTY